MADNHHRIQIETVYGPMVINRHDTIRGRCLIESGRANDHPEIELLVERLKARTPHGDGEAIDVGANFGCFTLAFAPHCERVIAIEMQPEVYLDLCESVRLAAPAMGFSGDAVRTFCRAAGKGGGLRSFPVVDYTKPQDFGSVRIVDGVPGTIALEESIDRIVRGEAVGAEPLTRVDLLKIDVEGMEMDVLEGARETIERFRPILYVEHLHSDRLALIAWIKAHGYRYVRQVGINLLADPNDAPLLTHPIVPWPDAAAINAAWPEWSEPERAEFSRISDVIDRLTVIDELGPQDNALLELIQTRIGRSMAERCRHGILLWIDCAHCRTHVDGDLPTLLSPAALATMERLAESAPPGCFVEVGVFKGGSLQRLYRIAQKQRRVIFGFDTFTGLPDHAAVDVIPQGHFNAGGEGTAEQIQRALPVARIVMGIFPDVLAAKVLWPYGEMLERIAFAHVDVDQYLSYKRTLAVLWERLVPGGIILCDDYDALHGAQLAVREMAFAFGINWRQLELTPEGKAILRKP